MEETPVEPVVKKRRGWPKGKARGARKASPVARPMFTPAPEAEAPIWVKIVLKNGWTAEFGCATHSVEGGFQVFTYAAEKDRYRTTRREFAISEIVELEVTGPRPAYRDEPMPELQFYTPPPPAVSTGPKIHSARASALQALETSKGPIKMDAMPNLTFGNSEG